MKNKKYPGGELLQYKTSKRILLSKPIIKMTEKQKLKEFGKVVAFGFIAFGMVDMIVQAFTRGEVRIIRSVLTTLFGVRG